MVEMLLRLYFIQGKVELDLGFRELVFPPDFEGYLRHSMRVS